jgi:transcriptional regulator with XRE-family HTH domain
MLLAVKRQPSKAPRTIKLGPSNTLSGMTKRDAGTVLASNLRRLMDHKPDLESGPKLERRSHVAQKTISNVLAGRHDTQLSTIEKLAKSFGLEAYHLLIPIEDEDVLRLVSAYNTSGENGRRVLMLAVRAAEGDERDARRVEPIRSPDHGREGADKRLPPLHAPIPKGRV